MLCLHYQDQPERARAVASVARRCRQLDARLVVFSPEAACETTREALARLEPGGARSRLTFRPLPIRTHRFGSTRAWDDAIEVVRTALVEVFAGGGPTVAWVDAPVTRRGATTARALRAYHDALGTLAAGNLRTVISAFRLADLSERARAGLLTGSRVLISAKAMLPRCPSWLVGEARPDVTPVTGVPAAATAAGPTEPVAATLCQAERLAVVGQLAAGISHEQGTLLSIISSSLQYLHQRLAATNDPASEFTRTALEAVERMEGLLHGMLDFAAVRKPRREQVDFQAVVSEILRFTSGECVRRGITVDVSFDPSLPPVWADPSGVKQILLNLIKNGLDALREGGEALRIRTRLRAEHQLAVIEVENDGPPIPADLLPDLFRPFYSAKEGGTGLGLYLSRQVAQDHGGHLKAANLPRGVRFTLTLPVDRRKVERP